MRYRVELSRDAEKQLARLPRDVGEDLESDRTRHRSCQRLRLRCLNGVMVRIPRARAKVIRRTSASFVRSYLDKLDFLGSFDDHPQQQHAMAPAPDVGFAPHALLVSHWQVDDLQVVLGGSKQ
jgi:hypothetical protein